MKTGSITLSRARRAARIVRRASEPRKGRAHIETGRRETLVFTSAFVERYWGHFGSTPSKRARKGVTMPPRRRKGGLKKAAQAAR